MSLPKGQETNGSVIWCEKRGGTRNAMSIIFNEILYTVGDSGVMAAYNGRVSVPINSAFQ